MNAENLNIVDISSWSDGVSYGVMRERLALAEDFPDMFLLAVPTHNWHIDGPMYNNLVLLTVKEIDPHCYAPPYGYDDYPTYKDFGLLKLVPKTSGSVREWTYAPDLPASQKCG
jgi:hypothetical protein